MNKQQFISMLEQRLHSLPHAEKEQILIYYNETIEDRMEDGMSEEESIGSLDTMDEIVNQIYADRDLQQDIIQQKKSYKSLKILALILLSPFWLTIVCLVLILYLVLWIIMAALVCVMICFGFTVLVGLWGIFPVWQANTASGMILLGCILFFLGCTPLCYKVVKTYVGWLIYYSSQWLHNTSERLKRGMKK